MSISIRELQTRQRAVRRIVGDGGWPRLFSLGIQASVRAIAGTCYGKEGAKVMRNGINVGAICENI
jgi:hypothetical protein